MSEGPKYNKKMLPFSESPQEENRQNLKEVGLNYPSAGETELSSPPEMTVPSARVKYHGKGVYSYNPVGETCFENMNIRSNESIQDNKALSYFEVEVLTDK